MLNGKSNRVDFVADNVTGGSALNRIGGATNDKRGNVVTGTVSNASTGFTSSNSPLLERIVLTMLARRPGKGMPLVPGRSRCE